MAYYGQGDFYSGAGDGFSFLKTGIKKAVGSVIPFGGAILTAGEWAAGKLSKRGVKASEFLRYGPTAATAMADIRAGRAGGQTLATRGQKDFVIPSRPYKTGRPGETQLFGPKVPFEGRRHRHMNVANVKALRRSVRRLAGFYALSHKVMVELGKVVHKHARHLPRLAPQQRLARVPVSHRLAPPKGDFYMGEG